MTGTAMTEANEFWQIYKLDVVEIRPNRPSKRKDFPDLVYLTEREKFAAIVDEVEELWKKGTPVLVGTRSIEKSEKLSHMLRAKGIPHKVLNAKYHEMEAQIISQAGRKGAVTIATNMAGAVRTLCSAEARRTRTNRRRLWSWAACTLSAASGTSRAVLTTSCAAAAPARETPAVPAFTFRWTTN